MLTSVNRHLSEDHLKESLLSNAFTAGLDFTQYFSKRLYYIDAKAMFSHLQGSETAILNKKRNATHYYQRESGHDYLDLIPPPRKCKEQAAMLRLEKGNAQWNYSQTFNWSSPGFDLNDVGYNKESDYLLNESEIAFRKTDPWGPFRFAGINLTQKNIWNFGGQAVNNDLGLRWRSLSTVHRFEMDVKETFSWNTVDSRRYAEGRICAMARILKPM